MNDLLKDRNFDVQKLVFFAINKNLFYLPLTRCYNKLVSIHM